MAAPVLKFRKLEIQLTEYNVKQSRGASMKEGEGVSADGANKHPSQPLIYQTWTFAVRHQI